MARVSYVIDDKEVKKALVTLGNRADAVIARAANRAMTTANKRMSKEVRERYVAVKNEDVKKALFKRRASANRPTATLIYKSKHENLYKMGKVSPRRIVKRNNPPFYEAQVMKDGQMTPLKRRPRPFVQKMPQNGHVGLFRRKSDDGLRKIEAVYAPALTQMMTNKEVLANVEKETGETFLKRLDHEIAWELRK